MSEPLIAAKVLSTVNSPLYGLHRPVTNIGQAVTFLGISSVRSLCLQYMLAEAFKPTQAEAQKAFDAIWKASAIASELDGHAAHQHGVAHLTVALEAQTLVIELTSPADNVVGFEHAPRKAGEKAAVAAGTSALRRPALFVPNPEASCGTARTEAVNPFASGDHRSHRDFTARHAYNCRQPEKLVLIDASPLFQALPRLRKLQADYALPAVQGSASLSPAHPRLRLERR